MRQDMVLLDECILNKKAAMRRTARESAIDK